MTMRIVFMGTPAFALPTLKALHEAGHEIAAVYTQPPRPAGRGQKDTTSAVHQYAEAHGLPVFTPVSLKDAKTQAEFAAHKAEAAVVVAYGLILPKPILEAYRLGCINVHPSLLPRWRGAAPIQRTIMAGDTETAVCIMQMDEGLDTGGVLLEERYHIPDSFDAGALHDMLAERAGPLVLMALQGLKDGTIMASPQEEDGATYANKITKEECRIDWTNDAEVIHNQIRGLSPSPGACFVFGGENIKVFTASFSKADMNKYAGKPLKAGQVIDNHLTVMCGKGILTLEELQRPGKKRLFSEAFLKGFSIPDGTVLE